jgi:hypothetical protein
LSVKLQPIPVEYLTAPQASPTNCRLSQNYSRKKRSSLFLLEWKKRKKFYNLDSRTWRRNRIRFTFQRNTWANFSTRYFIFWKISLHVRFQSPMHVKFLAINVLALKKFWIKRMITFLKDQFTCTILESGTTQVSCYNSFCFQKLW